MNTKGTVLISGVNGYIASRTAQTLLEAGYSVRGTVRSLSSAKGLQDVLKDYVEAGKLSVVEVPDITRSGAFDEAVKGIALFHLRMTTHRTDAVFAKVSTQ
jgi:nucleoside-diphosphate-sugar epimerase